jgi:hypothetical protein
MIRKKELHDINKSEIKTKHKAVQELDEMELFRTFKKYDRNMNGTLEFSEYALCLSECPGMNLSKQEITTSTLAADLNQDGRIDFEEFMKHFADFMNMMDFNRQLSSLYQKEQDHKKEMAMLAKQQEAALAPEQNADQKGKEPAGYGSSFAQVQSTMEQTASRVM